MIENKSADNSNLAIWNQVQQTDPSYTKSFNRTGGFRGTAIDPMYNIYRATELFGPIGVGWGYEILEEQIIEGAPIKHKDTVSHDKVHEMKIKLWYKYQGEIGSLVTSGATLVVSENKYGINTDEEAVKKSLTDALTKALSWLGFSADVHMGRYDDSKYVNGLKAAQNKDQNGLGQQGRKPQHQEIQNAGLQQLTEPPQVEGVSFEQLTGKDGNSYLIAKGDTYNKKTILEQYGFQKRKGEDGKWIVYRPVQAKAA